MNKPFVNRISEREREETKGRREINIQRERMRDWKGVSCSLPIKVINTLLPM